MTRRSTKIPSVMRAAVIDKFGPPSVIKVKEVPVPELGPKEVLIALDCAGVGIWDAKLRSGEYAEGGEKFPLFLGTDGAGRIAAVGSRVRKWGIGEKVWGYAYENPKGGFYAEYVAIAEDLIGNIPERLDLVRAGAAAVTALTALQGVADVLKVGKGETVLIFGASGAVGTLAVQFARSLGARVIGTVTTQDAATLVRRLGAQGAFDPRKKDCEKRIAELARDGFDAVLALAGGESLDRCLAHVRKGGRVAYPNGVEPEPKKSTTFHLTAYDAEGNTKQLDRLAKAVNRAKLKVVIAGQFPLAQTAKAHARVEKGHVLGRIVILPRR